MRIAIAVVFLSLASFGHEATEWARGEFARLTRDVFGEELRAEFLLPGETDGFAEDFAALKGTDGYAVRRKGGVICFVADFPRGHVNAVHRWLERNSDIIWPRPAGGLCLFTPRKPEGLITDYRDIPAFRKREFGGAGDAETEMYTLRNSGNGSHRWFRDVFGSGHNMTSFWFPPQEFAAEHPEYYMLVDGKRRTETDANLCESNPELPQVFAESVLRKLAKLPPECRTIVVQMADQGATCTCPECMKPIRLEDGGVVRPEDPDFRSTRFYRFFNDVARRIAAVRPELTIRQFGYMHLAVPPRVRLEPNIEVSWCPYPRNMKESVTEGPSNASWRQRLDGWLERTSNLRLREYYFCGCIYYPRPIADTAAVDLRSLARRGVRNVYCDRAAKCDSSVRTNMDYKLTQPFSDHWDVCGVEDWAVQRLFWDPSLDPAELRADYFRRVYRESAKDVAGFYRLLSKAWYSDPLASGWSDDAFRSAAYYIAGKGIEKECRAALENAERSAKDEGVRGRVQAIRRVFERWMREAPRYMTPSMRVPRGGTPAPIAGFRNTFGYDKSVNPFSQTADVVSDGEAFVFRFGVRKPPENLKGTGVKAGKFPTGDTIELLFASADGAPMHFAFDKDGYSFQMRGGDRTWTCPWTVAARTTADGWQADVRMPFASLGFRPHVMNRIRFTVMFNHTSPEKTYHVSWGGGMPHSADTWGEFAVDIE